ncbi:MAG: CHASE2 domain-containing protein, partial [Brachyspira sp.]|nr:CHASE2 domain-containing protein [Brachyspira sp.]
MLKKLLYFIWLVIFCTVAFVTLKIANISDFIDVIESRTFDLRQNVLINNHAKAHNDNIVIVAIDDASYEYILDNYGEWPLTRDVYAKLVDYLEAQHPQSVAFDLMFVKSMKSLPQADLALVNSFKKYDNLYTAMNFDNQPEDLRIPPTLPKKLAVNLKNNGGKVDFTAQTYTNCRSILPAILDATSNVGMINVSRAEDGILRRMPVFLSYQGKFYPQLGLKVGLNYLKNSDNTVDNNFVIDGNYLKLGNRKIYLDDNGNAILNWYGSAGTYEYIPLYKLIKIAKGEIKNEYDFNNKIVYFGTTASSLFDIKTVPVSRIYPGVEVQATYVNNIIDNNFIKKMSKPVTVVAGVILALLTGLIIMNISSAFVSSLTSLSLYVLYVLGAYWSMKYFNLWVDIVYPMLLALTAFISAYIVKYFITSRDFEHQYKLATTDGLTELYNHRYFQEQMKLNVENSKRYGNEFSMIILDIDFFKKFNDTYGHQSGDAVLRQVAQTLKRSVRATDIACRYGGEEMSIILPNTGKNVAHSTAEKICERVSSNKFKLQGDKEVSVTISLGVSTYPQDGQTPSELIE